MVTTTQVREGKQLDLVFTVPAAIKRAYRSKTTEYVEELIGHEGKGSLFATLKAGLYKLKCSRPITRKRLVTTLGS
jgi:secreted Zn-dependent insulinase-like peptidase